MPHEQEFFPSGALRTTRLLQQLPGQRLPSEGVSDFFGRAPGRTFRQDDAIAFSGSGISGTQLARNPELNLFIAQVLQRDIDTFLAAGTPRSGISSLQGSVPKIDQRNASFFRGTSFAFDFFNEQNRIRQDFVSAEVLKQFGPQNITSRTVAAGGPGGSVAPTSAQRNEIAASFQTPLQLALAHKPTGPQTPSGAASGVASRGDPTIISGAGIRRRRLSGAPAAPTILTSDSAGTARRGRAVLGGATLLG